MSESLTVSMQNQRDSTLQSGALSYEWLQLILFGAMAFLGWLLCSQAIAKTSQRLMPRKKIESPKVELEAKDFDVDDPDEQPQSIAKEALQEEDAKKKKKQRSKKARKIAEDSEEVTPKVSAAAEEQITAEIVCVSDFEPSELCDPEPRDGWIVAGSKRSFTAQPDRDAREVKEEDDKKRRAEERKFDWYEESKDTEPMFLNKVSEISYKAPANKPTPECTTTFTNPQKKNDLQAEKPEKPEKPSKIEKIEKTEETEKTEKPKKLEQTQKIEKTEIVPSSKWVEKGNGTAVKPNALVSKPSLSEKTEISKSAGKGQKPVQQLEPSSKPSHSKKSEKGKSAGKGQKHEQEVESSIKASQLIPPKAGAPPPPNVAPSLAAWEGLTWAERMRLSNPTVEKDEPAMPPPKGCPVRQEESSAVEKPERTQRKKKQRRQQGPSEPHHKPVVVPPKISTGAPGWQWDMSEDGCSGPVSEEQVMRQQQGAPGWHWDVTEDGSGISQQQAPLVVPPPPKKIPGVAPGWTWDTTEEFPHPDPETGSMPVVVPPRSKAILNTQSKSMQLGIVVNWGSKGFGFLGDQMGNRFYAKQEIVRGGGKLRIGAFVWFRLNDMNPPRVAEVANLEDNHEWVVKKALAEGVAWCRLRCEIDGDVTILSEEEAGFPGKFHRQALISNDLKWDVDLIQVSSDAKMALHGEVETSLPEDPAVCMAAMPEWLDSNYMASAPAPECISATTLHGASDDFWYHAEVETNDQWTMVPMDTEVPYEEEIYQPGEGLSPNLGAYADSDEDDSDAE